MRIYNERLDERIKRKKFVIDRAVLEAQKEKSVSQLARSQEDKDLVIAFKIFSRFNSKLNHSTLVNGLIHEKHLREVANQLVILKKKGIQTLEEAEKMCDFMKKNGQDFSRLFTFLKNPTELIPASSADLLPN